MTVKDACTVFNVSRSGYYAWLKAGAGRIGKRQMENMALRNLIIDIVMQKTYVPGARKMASELRRRYQISADKDRVSSLMKEMNLRASSSRRRDAYKGQIKPFHPCCAMANYVNREFYSGCRCIVLTDITYIYYGVQRDNLAYLCTFLDPYTREVLGWNISETMDTSLVTSAWDHMMSRHGDEFPEDRQIYVHSDQGSQYHAAEYKELLSNNFIQSMSRRGNSQDNAPQESFFGRMKERMDAYFALPETFEQICTMINTYIHQHNTEEHCPYLADLTPEEYYQYSMTGIYPNETYFGVQANELHTLQEVIAGMRIKARNTSVRRKEARSGKQISTIDPVQRILEDTEKLLKKQRQESRKISRAQEAIDEIDSLIAECGQALEYVRGLSEEEYNALRTPSSWSGHPELSYTARYHTVFD